MEREEREMCEMNPKICTIRRLLARARRAANDTAASKNASFVKKSVMLHVNYTISAPCRFSIIQGNRQREDKLFVKEPPPSCLIDLNRKVVWVAQEEEPLTGEFVNTQRFMRNPRLVEFRSDRV